MPAAGMPSRLIGQQRRLRLSEVGAWLYARGDATAPRPRIEER